MQASAIYFGDSGIKRQKDEWGRVWDLWSVSRAQFFTTSLRRRAHCHRCLALDDYDSDTGAFLLIFHWSSSLFSIQGYRVINCQTEPISVEEHSATRRPMGPSLRWFVNKWPHRRDSCALLRVSNPRLVPRIFRKVGEWNFHRRSILSSANYFAPWGPSVSGTGSRLRRWIKYFRSNTLENDIALVKIDEPVAFTEYIRPVCLPDPTVDVTSKTYRLNGLASCYILGWGEVKLRVSCKCSTRQIYFQGQ